MWYHSLVAQWKILPKFEAPHVVNEFSCTVEVEMGLVKYSQLHLLASENRISTGNSYWFSMSLPSLANSKNMKVCNAQHFIYPKYQPVG
jgi:hypothetical protein